MEFKDCMGTRGTTGRSRWIITWRPAGVRDFPRGWAHLMVPKTQSCACQWSRLIICCSVFMKCIGKPQRVRTVVGCTFVNEAPLQCDEVCFCGCAWAAGKGAVWLHCVWGFTQVPLNNAAPCSLWVARTFLVDFGEGATSATAEKTNSLSSSVFKEFLKHQIFAMFRKSLCKSFSDSK